MQTRQPGANRLRRYVHRLDLGPDRFHQLSQVAAIGASRVRREISLRVQEHVESL